ncbi:MAG: sodium:solute symporter, partial [bacterium]|nr:sodium:solute symporter [bacterium]
MGFETLDIIVLVLYFGAMAAMGPLFAKKGRTTEGYFLGDRSFPGWLIGFSMFATSISSITFMAYPGDGYKTAWLRMIPNFTLPLAVLMASYFFLPFFRRGKITSAYEYLEGRFGPKVRLYAALAFIVSQVIRISMILFLVSQLVQEVT